MVLESFACSCIYILCVWVCVCYMLTCSCNLCETLMEIMMDILLHKGYPKPGQVNLPVPNIQGTNCSFHTFFMDQSYANANWANSELILGWSSCKDSWNVNMENCNMPQQPSNMVRNHQNPAKLYFIKTSLIWKMYKSIRNLKNVKFTQTRYQNLSTINCW
jgi:hypothetical protein